MRDRLATLFALSAVALQSGGCSTPRLYYETTVFDHATLRDTAGQRKGLIQRVRSELGDRTLEIPGPGGVWVKVHPGKALASVDPALLFAVVAVADDDYLGAEADIIIHGPGKRRTPISVKVGLDGSVYASAGATMPKLRAWSGPRQVATAKAGGSGVLGAALARLSKAERSVLDTIHWRRGGRAPGAKGGHYQQRGCNAQIHMYDRAFAADRLQFTGDPGKPSQAALRSLLHEIGHAIHHRPSRKAWCNYEAFKSRGEARPANQWGQQAQNLDASGGPVLAAYERALGDHKAPTTYGEESVAESFAESFSIWKTDRAALKRALPHIAQWFAQGGHMKALN